MSLDGSALYFDVRSHDAEGNRVEALARALRGAGESWGTQTAELFFNSGGPLHGLSGDGTRLIFSGGAFQKGDPLGGRLSILQIDGLIVLQDFTGWSARWTVDDTLYVVGSAGKGRKLRHPIDEFFPLTGDRVGLGISMDAHFLIDSSL